MVLGLLLFSLIMTSKIHHIFPFTVSRYLQHKVVLITSKPSQQNVRQLSSSFRGRKVDATMIKSSGISSPQSSSIPSSSDVPLVDYTSIIDNDGSLQYGDYTTIASQISITRVYQDIKQIGIDDSSDNNDSSGLDGIDTSKLNAGDVIWIRGRVSSVRAKGNACFLVIRGGSFYTIQACHFKDKSNPDISKAIIKYVGAIPLESIIDIQGKLVTADVKSCSQSNVELQIQKVFVVSRAPSTLPFLLEDASRSESEIEQSQSTERPFAGVSQVSSCSRRNSSSGGCSSDRSSSRRSSDRSSSRSRDISDSSIRSSRRRSSCSNCCHCCSRSTNSSRSSSNSCSCSCRSCSCSSYCGCGCGYNSTYACIYTHINMN